MIIMNNISYRISTYLLVGFLCIGLLFSGCNKDDDDDLTAIELLSFGPSPILRGAELKIIGNNLDKVTAVQLANNVMVTSFNSKTPDLITLTVPEETVDGHIVLKTPEGDITSLTLLTISEPIVLSSFSPESLRPEELLTIEGDYLNLIKTVIFSSNVAVGDTAFVSHSREKIEIIVPEAAQTGIITLSNGEEEPILVESENLLNVTVPLATSLSPNPVKAGTLLTIEGTDLDLTRQIGFEGTLPISEFVSQTPEKIEVIVPEDAHDGDLLMIPGSFIEVPASEPLVMVVPQILNISPIPIKNGQNITVTGQDLDLISKVIFGGGKIGAILGGGSDTEITVKVPINATEDLVAFHTKAEKVVNSAQILLLVKPVITGFSPDPAAFEEELTIEGTDLDLIVNVIFSGGVEASLNNAFPTEAFVDVPIGASSGPITVVTTNGTEVVSTIDFNLAVSINAVITSIPEIAAPGEMITILGENLDEINELIFPDEVPATMFGQKTATTIEVFVPMNTAIGVGNIKFITFEGQEFFSPPINFQGVEPVADPDLVFFNFDGLDSWWGDTGEVENDPAYSLDGSNYFRANDNLSGWTGLFWRNGGDNFPGATIGTNVSDYVLKFDINVLEPITGGDFSWRLKGSDGDFWHAWKPWEESGSFMTNGWITVTIPLTEFYDGSTQIPDMNNITEDFGVAFNNGDSYVNVCIDNVRFEAL